MRVAEKTWLDQLREQAVERFAELGFPTTHEEEWRFTNVAPIARIAFEPAGRDTLGITAQQIERIISAGPHTARVVFVNGRYAPDLSRAVAGIRAGSLAEALANNSEKAGLHLGRYASFEKNAFVAMNTASFGDGAYVQVPNGLILEAPIHLVFVSSAGRNATVSHPRNLIVAGAHSQATVIESYIGFGDQVYFTNAVTEIVAGDACVLDHYKVQLEREQSFHVSTMQVQQGCGASFTSHSISLGGALVRNDVNAVLAEGGECTLNGLYLVHGTQHVDNHTWIDHAKPHGSSHELYKGILSGRANAVFSGKILVRKDAQKTDAKQTNKNLVLSEDAVINTKPELQIHADDVRCTHGATIGQLDPEAMFYLQSRGIGKEDARAMLTYAFARDIVDRVKVEPLRERLEALVFERMHGYRG